jgi:hypothetical protein
VKYNSVGYVFDRKMEEYDIWRDKQILGYFCQPGNMDNEFLAMLESYCESSSRMDFFVCWIVSLELQRIDTKSDVCDGSTTNYAICNYIKVLQGQTSVKVYNTLILERIFNEMLTVCSNSEDGRDITTDEQSLIELAAFVLFNSFSRSSGFPRLKHFFDVLCLLTHFFPAKSVSCFPFSRKNWM